MAVLKLNKHPSKGKLSFKLWMKRIAWSLILLFSWEQPFWVTPELLSHPLNSPAATAKKIFHPSKGTPEVSTQEEPYREDIGELDDPTPPEGPRSQEGLSRNPILKWVAQLVKGYTLIEVLAVLAIIAILATMAVTLTYQITVKAQQAAVRQEMKNLKEALIGNPALMNHGVRTDFGYLGDIGSLPENPADLDKLVRKNSNNWDHPDWFFDRFLRVGAGWDGPYITGTFTEENLWFKADEWGNDYTYDTSNYTNPQGDLVDAKIQSWGPDEAPNTDDDITVEILNVETKGSVIGYLNRTNNQPLPNTIVSIHYPKDGRLVSQSKLTDGNGYYQFDDIPYGVRSVSLGAGVGKISYVPNSVTTTGNGKNVLFSVQNVSSSELTVTSLKVEFPTFDFYEAVRVNGEVVFSRTHPRIESGETIYLNTPFTLASGSSVQAPMNVTVAKPVVQVPTTVLAPSESTLSTIQIELQGFSDQISGPSTGSDMRGVPITITFNGEPVIRFSVSSSGAGGKSEPVGFGRTAVPLGLAGLGLVFTAVGHADLLEAREQQLEEAEAALLRSI